jgi:hypothetical protein
MRIALTVFLSFCVATILSQAVGIGLLWFTGYLNASTIGKALAVLAGDAGVEAATERAEAEPVRVTQEQLLEHRAIRLLDLDHRNREVEGRVDFAADVLAKVREEREALDNLWKSFEDELKQVEESETSEGMEKVRSILAKLKPSQAKDLLMKNDVDEAVRLLAEMPDRTVAKLLKEFKTDAEMQRAEEILRALNEGREQGEAARKAQEELEKVGR